MANLDDWKPVRRNTSRYLRSLPVSQQLEWATQVTAEAMPCSKLPLRLNALAALLETPY
jgi:hypothetical protein